MAKNKIIGKVETVEEFLARGGKITKIEIVETLCAVATTPIVASRRGALSEVDILSFDDAALYFGEDYRPMKKKKGGER